ncbi:MAG: DUF2927 domain-containing protein [Methanoregula sp.]|jgi:hypothetical protein|uniref:DUF2927 domain-containing protein n=1 Tax=Methanoregula sp. TaxID=2052170 RepID=UPI0025F7F9B9|nr:DUF2927 domain-containing protein [Methanoregula sp.]MCK9631743.1 DUF2927 domain-containing protein [Methanoregula sp.]
MKAGWAFLLSGIFIIAVGLAWIFTGWSPGSPASSPGQSSSPSLFPGFPSLGPSAGEGAVATQAPVTPTPTVPETPAAQETPALSSDDIRLHFLDLAFGAGNANLERWNATDNNGRIVIALTANNNADTRLLENAVREFNSVSKTNQISEMIKQGGTGDITIKFIPESGMGGIAINASDGRTPREFSVDGVTAAKISRGSVYINANLKGDVRNHTLIRSLFYELGVAGDSDTYPDSVFYSGNNTNTNLTYADKKAIEIMYGSGLTPGMSVNEVKGIIYIR